MVSANLNWTLEEALAAQKEALAKDPTLSWSDPTLPFYQWDAMHRLIHCEKMFADGDTWFLTQAIRICANHDLPLPPWAATAYIQAYDAVNGAKKRSWDDVFGRPYAKGANISAIRKKRMLMWGVFNRVTDIKKCEPTTPIDAGLFERVGREFNIGKTLAAEYYYSAKKRNQS